MIDKKVIALNIPEAFIPAMVRYNEVQQYIYWTDVGSRKILRQRFTDTKAQEVFKASKYQGQLIIIGALIIILYTTKLKVKCWILYEDISSGDLNKQS